MPAIAAAAFASIVAETELTPAISVTDAIIVMFSSTRRCVARRHGREHQLRDTHGNARMMAGDRGAPGSTCRRCRRTGLPWS